jgi:hypothetical protein
MSSKMEEKELKLYFRKCVPNFELETITQKLSWGIAQEFFQKLLL